VTLAPKVLIVEDYLDTANMLALILKNCGFSVHHAPDGESALASAMAWDPDLVLLDIGLPKMDGYEVARRLRRDVGLGDDVKIIALSGFQPNETRQRESGIDHYMMKPLDLPKLRALVGC
jgi:DNA-binding response OmpR family regulator